MASYTSGNVGLAFGLVIAAGACTSLGAALVFCSSLTNHRVLSGALGASAGVMTYVSFVEIFSTKAVEAFQSGGFSQAEGARYAALCFFGGAAFTWLLDKVVHFLVHAAEAVAARRERRRRAGAVEAAEARAATAVAKTASSADCTDLEAPSSPPKAAAMPPAPLSADRDRDQGVAPCGGALAAGCEPCDGGSRCPHGAPLAVPKGESDEMRRVLQADHHAALARTGLLSALAVGIHNFPEGLATFVATLASPSAGAAIAVAIALHNIPEGVVVAMPIYYATGSKWKGFLWSFVSGLAEPVGGLVGYALLVGGGGMSSPLVFAITYGFVAGMMVYIAIRELLPTALRYDPEDRYATASFFAGAAVMAASLLLFRV